MASSLPPTDPPRRFPRWPEEMFETIEHAVYVALAALLSLTALLALASAGFAAFDALRDWGDVAPILHVTERLLFALMLIEILHTVRASLRSGTLTPEPFLVVGLIATIRRMLVITLESSQQTQPRNWSSQAESLFHAAMLELTVLGGLVLVLVGSIFLLRRRSPP